MYTKNKVGLIPAILDQWFNQRKEFKNKRKSMVTNDDEKYVFYKRRQHVQKILLNSLYGVLGLPIFRFYDVDNAEAVTTTGVSVIKFSRQIANHYYNKILDDTEDHCIYIDTDSVFFSALPIVENNASRDLKNDDEMATAILKLQCTNLINKSYDVMANVSQHRRASL